MQLNLESAIPLYTQLAEHLQRQIEAGVYPAGDRLPSERELAETFQVSRMTARQAVQQLVQNGLAYSQVGKGTFVTSPKIHQELRELTSFSEEMQRRGAKPGSRVIVQEARPASDHTTELLQLPLNSIVMVLQRIRLADDQPLALETAYLNPQYCPGLLEGHDFSQQSLYKVLREVYHLRLVWANQWIEARLPTSYEQSQLNIHRHEPVLSLIRVTFNDQEIPLELVRSVYIGKHYQLRTTLQMGDKSG